MIEICVSLAFLIPLISVVPRRFHSVIISAYILRVTLCYIHAYVLVLPDSQFDAIVFERTAWLWARDGECFDDFTTGSRLYSWIGSCIYTVVGRSALLLQVLNAFLGTLVVLVGMKAIRLLAPLGLQYRYAGWVLALHPSLLLYSAITMREVVIVLTFIVSIYWLAKWRITGKYGLGAWSILWMIVSQMFHTGMVTATVLITGIYLYYTITEHWRGLVRVKVMMRNAKAAALSLVVMATLGIAVSIMLNEGYGLDKLQRLRTGSVIDALTGWQEQSARGRASYLGGGAPSDWVALLLQMPVRLVYFVGAPFPWDISRVRDLWGFIDGGFLIILVLVIVRDIKKGAWRRRAYRSIAAVVFAVILGFSVATSNYGTAFRHRAKFVPALIVLYSYGSGQREWRRKEGLTVSHLPTHDRRG